MDSKKAVRQLKEIQKLVRGSEMRLAASGWDEDWKILISTILSAVTRDEVTVEVCEKLFRRYNSLESLGRARVSTIEKIIRRVNFYKTKSLNVLATARELVGKKIPDSVSELIKLPGVGRKVANVYLAEAHKKDVIGVDTHVARISFKLGWTSSKNSYRIEKDLEKLFPKKYWRSINETLVLFGRSFGRSRRREDLILDGLK